VTARGTGFEATSDEMMLIFCLEAKARIVSHLTAPDGWIAWSPKAMSSFNNQAGMPTARPWFTPPLTINSSSPGGPPSIFDAERGKITGVSLTFFRGDDRVLVEGEASYSCGNTNATGQIRQIRKRQMAKIMRTLATDEIGKSYRGRRVVNGVSLRVEQGEVVGFSAPTVAGKDYNFLCHRGPDPP